MAEVGTAKVKVVPDVSAVANMFYLLAEHYDAMAETARKAAEELTEASKQLTPEDAR